MMRFRQPSDLARIINYLLDQLQAGESIELIFTQRGQDTRVYLHLLEVVTEVAGGRNISVEVTETVSSAFGGEQNTPIRATSD